jgi:hypothetical protein
VEIPLWGGLTVMCNGTAIPLFTALEGTRETETDQSHYLANVVADYAVDDWSLTGTIEAILLSRVPTG